MFHSHRMKTLVPLDKFENVSARGTTATTNFLVYVLEERFKPHAGLVSLWWC